MGKVIAVVNQKGGVGKTTTSVNLAASLVATKRRVLLIDLDPQGNATMGSGVDKENLEHSVGDVLVGNAVMTEALVMTDPAGYQLLPTNGELTSAEIALLDMSEREYRLRNALLPIQAGYDYVIIDCPPSLNMLTINALVAADEIFIPMQCEYYALEGLSGLMETVQQIKQNANPKIEIGGLLRTMYDPRNCLTAEVSEQLHTHFGERVYTTVIPRNVRLAEAPSFGLPVLHHDAKSQGAKAYLALAGEFIRRHETEMATVV